MPNSPALTGAGMPAQVANIMGDVPAVLAAAGTNQAGAVQILSNNTSINAQSSKTGVFLPTATQATAPDTLLYTPFYLNYSTLSAANPVIYVNVGGYLNGTLNGSTTLLAGQNAVAWQQAAGVYYLVKNTT
jgi:hypothetical protein